jgi:hypothetical protein
MQKKKKRPFIKYLGAFGIVSTGIIYVAVGIIAILSFLRLKQGGADEGSFLVYIDKFLAGRILILVILSGMISYIIRRLYEAVRDPYKYGNKVTGIAKRTATGLSSIADGLVAFSAIQALWMNTSINETGIPTAQRKAAGEVMQHQGGSTLIIILGVIICIIALIQAGYMITGHYKERMNMRKLPGWKKTSIQTLAWVGHIARGIIVGIIGYSLLKSGVNKNPAFVVNTDKAFDFIGDNIGHPEFIAVAAGTVCYGMFMFAYAFYFDPRKD